jgi:hypothetical protein
MPISVKPGTLEELIRHMAEKGELNYLSVIPVSGGRFSATFAPASGFGHSYAEHTDPVTALVSAIHEWKPRRKSKQAPHETPIETAVMPWE